MRHCRIPPKMNNHSHKQAERSPLTLHGRRDEGEGLRLQAYRQMLFLDPIEDDSIQARTQRWSNTEQHINALLNRHGSTPDEEAEICLTLLVLLQVGIRNYEPLTTTLNRTFDVLPHISDSKLRTHLLVYLYQETEDEDLAEEIDTLMSTWDDTNMTEEDHYLQELYKTIETTY